MLHILNPCFRMDGIKNSVQYWGRFKSQEKTFEMNLHQIKLVVGYFFVQTQLDQSIILRYNLQDKLAFI